MKDYIFRVLFSVIPIIILMLLIQLSVVYISNKINIETTNLALVRIFDILFYGYGLITALIMIKVIEHKKKKK